MTRRHVRFAGARRAQHAPRPRGVGGQPSADSSRGVTAYHPTSMLPHTIDPDSSWPVNPPCFHRRLRGPRDVSPASQVAISDEQVLGCRSGVYGGGGAGTPCLSKPVHSIGHRHRCNLGHVQWQDLNTSSRFPYVPTAQPGLSATRGAGLCCARLTPTSRNAGPPHMDGDLDCRGEMTHPARRRILSRAGSGTTYIWVAKSGRSSATPSRSSGEPVAAGSPLGSRSSGSASKSGQSQ
jgi:hypothetical protein